MITIDIIPPPGEAFRQLIESKKLEAGLRDDLREVAQAAVAEIRATLLSGGRSGRRYRVGAQRRYAARGVSFGGGAKFRRFRGRTYTASAPGEPPARLTGTLARALKASLGKRGKLSAFVTVRSRTGFYGLFLEKGRKGKAGRSGGVTRFRTAGRHVGWQRKAFRARRGAAAMAARPFLAPSRAKYEELLYARVLKRLESVG